MVCTSGSVWFVFCGQGEMGFAGFTGPRGYPGKQVCELYVYVHAHGLIVCVCVCVCVQGLPGIAGVTGPSGRSGNEVS